MRATHQIVEEQCKKWQILHAEKKKEKVTPAITISREPGSGGRFVAEKIAEIMELDVFHQEVIHQMAENANVSTRLLETLDEKGLNILEDWIASFNKKHLWPDAYMKHLVKVVSTIASHGHAIIVGRGANFILPAEVSFRIRIVSPRKSRINNIARTFVVSGEEAKQRIIRTESERRAFIRKYFYSDISDPTNYDIIINMENISIDAAAHAVKCALENS